MQKWKYKMTYLSTEKALNLLGLNGWELVSTGRVTRDGVEYVFCVFKRPIEHTVNACDRLDVIVQRRKDMLDDVQHASESKTTIYDALYRGGIVSVTQ